MKKHANYCKGYWHVTDKPCTQQVKKGKNCCVKHKYQEKICIPFKYPPLRGYEELKYTSDVWIQLLLIQKYTIFPKFIFFKILAHIPLPLYRTFKKGDIVNYIDYYSPISNTYLVKNSLFDGRFLYLAQILPHTISDFHKPAFTIQNYGNPSFPSNHHRIITHSLIWNNTNFVNRHGISVLSLEYYGNIYDPSSLSNLHHHIIRSIVDNEYITTFS